jgi:hypothetical protein
MQLAELLNVPLPLLVQLTVPVGVLAVPVLASLTVAVHVVDVPTSTEVGLQLTLVVLLRLAVTVRLKVPLLPVCVESPL